MKFKTVWWGWPIMGSESHGSASISLCQKQEKQSEVVGELQKDFVIKYETWVLDSCTSTSLTMVIKTWYFIKEQKKERKTT